MRSSAFQLVASIVYKSKQFRVTNAARTAATLEPSETIMNHCCTASTYQCIRINAMQNHMLAPKDSVTMGVRLMLCRLAKKCQSEST